MRSLVWGNLRRDGWRSAAVAAVIALAAASFVLLTAASRTTDARVEGTVSSNYRAAYDILVRPRGSQSALERSRGLVANNALGGLFGGITLAEYRRILRIQGIQVAAPVANVGFIVPYAVPSVSLDA